VPDEPSPPTRWAATAAPRGDDYDRRWDELAAAGADPHGEATFVMRTAPRRVLDAGCGTGRVARELARRGVSVVGVDVDATMLATAARKNPELPWVLADLATLTLPDEAPFDVAVLAGNVMIFVHPGSERDVLAHVAAHVAVGGLVIAGFQLQPGGLDLATYDTCAAAVGLALVERWATWSADPFVAAGATYAVSVHRRTT
jgi:SAM-dependent methyltransferase